MSNLLQQKSWSPWVVGAAIGVLSWFSFWSAAHPLGITTAFEHTSAFILEAVAPGQAAANSYYTEESPKIGWEWMLVVGVFLGSIVSSLVSGDRETYAVPPMWSERFGSNVAMRLVVAFFSAGLMLFGARLANGCTSGHGISGNLQLAASSWVFSLVFFVVGISTAWLVYKRQGGSHV